MTYHAMFWNTIIKIKIIMIMILCAEPNLQHNKRCIATESIKNNNNKLYTIINEPVD
jgi:hypothetical protein